MGVFLTNVQKQPTSSIKIICRIQNKVKKLLNCWWADVHHNLMNKLLLVETISYNFTTIVFSSWRRFYILRHRLDYYCQLAFISWIASKAQIALHKLWSIYIHVIDVTFLRQEKFKVCWKQPSQKILLHCCVDRCRIFVPLKILRQNDYCDWFN